MKFLMITSGAHGVVFNVTDEDRTWKIGVHTPLPPDFLEYDAFKEVKYVIQVARENNAPTWVVEKLKKYLQTLR